MKQQRVWFLVFIILGSALLWEGCSHPVVVREPLVVSSTPVVVAQAPPPLRAEVIGPAPSGEYVWVPGYWRYESGQYVWIAGRYELRPRPGATWVPGHWQKLAKGWEWSPGHWE